MREIVHIQAGQCGNQIGAKVSGVSAVDGDEMKSVSVCVHVCAKMSRKRLPSAGQRPGKKEDVKRV